MRVGYATDSGKQRPLNEDSLCVNEEFGLFIVADGMGGHNAGEVASAYAVNLAGALIEESLANTTDATALVRETIAQTNSVIFAKSLNKTAWSEMGTTLVVALFLPDKVIIGHVGDSRAYMVDQESIVQLTEDHTFVAEWLKQGLITEEEARYHQQRHGLTEALGVADQVETDIAVFPWDAKKCLLLCTDGLTDMLEDHEIFTITKSSEDPQDVADSLVAAANERGGRDNITVIYICGSE
jgi:protein phosphatase